LWGYFVIALSAAAIAVFSFEGIGEFDSWWHMRRASLYLSQGITKSGFPCLPYSIADRCHSDVWYGFHLLISPFSLVHDPILQMKLAATFLLSASLVIMCLGIRRLGIGNAWAWSLLLPFTGMATIARFT
jgi:hypothetical protein